MIAGQVRPSRQSSGTQNRSPSGPWTHPFESRRLAGIGRPEKASRLLDREATVGLSDKNELTLKTKLDYIQGSPCSVFTCASHIRIVLS